MSKSGELIHPNWDLPMVRVTDGFSIEITAKDIDALKHVAPSLPPDTPVSVTFLPGEDARKRELRRQPRSGSSGSSRCLISRRGGSNPMLSLRTYLDAVVEHAQVRRCFVIAGDRERRLAPSPTAPR